MALSPAIVDDVGGAAARDTFGSIEKFFGSDTAADTMTGGPSGRFKFFGFGKGGITDFEDGLDRIK